MENKVCPMLIATGNPAIDTTCGRNCVPGGYPPLMVAGVVLSSSWEQRRRRNSVYKTCPDCGAYLDPEERCNCGGPVFRLRVGSTVELIDQATFMDILQKMKEGQNGRQEVTAQGCSRRA